MLHELIYTSSPRGLKAGATGYCTVAHTPNLPTDLSNQLEGISHYRHLQVGSSASESANPVAYAHSVLTTGYTVHHVVSRVADSGLDHSGRSNFLAHHVAFGTDSLPDAGPAWLCGQRFFVMKWDRAAGLIPDDRSIPSGHPNPKTCHEWKRLTGDAGWGGVLAAATNAAEPATIIFEPGQDVLALIAESMALLASEARWNVTFNTYFTGSAVRTTCQWRCVVANSVEAKEALTARRGAILRLDQPMGGVPSGPLVEAGRTGIVALPAPLRRAAPAAVRTTRRPVEEELPEPDLLPMTRRPRAAPPQMMDESNDELDLREPATLHSSGSRGSVGPLLLGLALGGLLILALLSLVEIVGGQSLLGMMTGKGKDFEESKREVTRLEAELKSKGGLDSEKKDAERARDSARSDFRKKEDELTRVSGELAQLKIDYELIKNKPPVVVSGDGIFMKARVLQREQARQKMLKDAQNEVADLRNEIKIHIAKQGANTGRIKVVPIATALDKIAAAGGTIPGINLKNPKDTKIDLFGISDDMKPEPRERPNRVAIFGRDGFKADLEIKDGGEIELKHTMISEHPFLGLAILRLDSGVGAPEYFQLFRRKLKDAIGQYAITEKDIGLEQTYRLNMKHGLEELNKDLSNSSSKLAGRNARVKIGEKHYDLDVGDDPLTLEYRGTDKVTSIKLTVESTEVVISVTFAEAKDLPKPNRCGIDSLEIVRILPADPDRKFPGFEQELLRYYPGAGK